MEVLRGNFVAFTHPVHTQKQLFGILGHVSTMIMLGTSDQKKHTFWYIKKVYFFLSTTPLPNHSRARGRVCQKLISECVLGV